MIKNRAPSKQILQAENHHAKMPLKVTNLSECKMRTKK